MAGGQDSLRDVVANELRLRIFEGRLQPGSHIDQATVAEELAVSRMPVREALGLLSEDGLVEYRARRGAFVSRLTRVDIYDHFELYGIVAGHAASRAARYRHSEDLDELEHLISELESVEHDPRRADDLNVRFHRRINRCSRSRRLHLTLDMLARAMPTDFFARRSRWKPHLDRQHRRILEAISEKDAQRADELTRKHLLTGAQIIITYFEEQQYFGNGNSKIRA